MYENNITKDKEQELAKLKKEKMKEFSEAARKVFNQIDNIGVIEQEYYTGLGSTAGAAKVGEQ